MIDVNDGPSGLQLIGSQSVPENSPPSAYVADVQALDDDVNQTHTYKLLAVAEG